MWKYFLASSSPKIFLEMSKNEFCPSFVSFNSCDFFGNYGSDFSARKPGRFFSWWASQKVPLRVGTHLVSFPNLTFPSRVTNFTLWKARLQHKPRSLSPSTRTFHWAKWKLPFFWRYQVPHRQVGYKVSHKTCGNLVTVFNRLSARVSVFM